MKKLLSIVLSLALIITSCCIFPLTSFAKENDEYILSYDAKDIYTAPRKSIFPRLRNSKSATLQKEIIALRDALVQRQPSYSIELDMSMSQNELTNYLLDIFYGAISFDYSQTNIDAQYAQYHIGGFDAKAEYKNGKYYATFLFTYRSNAREELAVNNVIKKFFSSVDVNNISDYELLKKIHDFIIDGCTYSYDFNNQSVYTAWGALCDGQTVCEGYALAFYRLCKEAGLDVVMDISDPDEGCHAWNVVKLGDKCYYVDTTWDDTEDENNEGRYDYFLVDYDTLRENDDELGEHINYEEQTNYSYLENNYFSKVDDEPFSTSSKVISNCTVTVNNNGSVSVKDNDGKVLTNGVDYTVQSDSNSTVKIVGKGDYSGSSSRKTAIYNYKSSVNSPAYIVNGYATPDMSVANLNGGNDYLVYCFNNDSIGNATAIAYGIGKYTGFVSNSFDIQKADINLFNIVLAYDFTVYNGSAKKPDVYIDGLAENEDYTVSYSDNVNAGTAYVTIRGKGNYTGMAVRTFTISKPNIADCSITLDKTSFEYTGGAIKPSVNVFGCVEGIDYVLTFSDNTAVGTASVTVNGIGYYSGSKTFYFTIYAKPTPTPAPTPNPNPNPAPAPAKSTTVSKPKKVTLSKLKTSKKSITVYWKKVSCSGYQIEYSTNKNFKKSKKITVKSGKATSKKITKLSKGKKYYFRVRAYTNSNGKKLYGSWSKTKNIKCI